MVLMRLATGYHLLPDASLPPLLAGGGSLLLRGCALETNVTARAESSGTQLLRPARSVGKVIPGGRGWLVVSQNTDTSAQQPAGKRV